MRESLIKVAWWIFELVLALAIGLLLLTLLPVVAVASLPVALLIACFRPGSPVAKIKNFYRKLFEWWVSLYRDFIP